MTRDEQIKIHNESVKKAFGAAKKGEIINLSALIGGAERIHLDDYHNRAERENAGSENWKVANQNNT